MRVIELTAAERLTLIAPVREIISAGDVLEIIDPVDPDNVFHLGDGIYEARWMDKEIAAEEITQLCNVHRARIVIVSEAPFRPEGLPTWVAVQFCVIPLPIQTTDVLQ